MIIVGDMDKNSFGVQWGKRLIGGAKRKNWGEERQWEVRKPRQQVQATS